uniref:YadA family autotransporter adhesin n=1 Tax=Paraburkholderia sp. TaxID=1926495 RepID=UPI0025F9BD25
VGQDSVAIGMGAVANNANDVALGANSVTGAANPTASGTIDGTNYSFAGAAPTSVVSVGSAGAERQITNVAAGQLSAASTDAVNGSQLYATNQAVDSLNTAQQQLNDQAVKYGTNPDGSVNDSSVTLGGATSTDGGVTGGTKITNVAQGDLSSTSTDAVNGSQLNATNQNVAQNTADITGLGDQVDNLYATGAKYFHANSTGTDSQAVGQDSVAIGMGAVANNAGDVALGANSVTGTANPTASGTIDGTTYTYAGAAPMSVVSIGSVGAERQITNVAAGQLSAASTDAVNGSQLYATNQALSSLDAAINNLGDTVSKNLGGGSTHNSADGTVGAPSYVVNNHTYDNVGDALAAAANGSGAYYYGVNDGGTQGGNYNNDGATGSNSIAMGVNTVSSGTNSTAVGNGASANGTGSTALGNGAIASGTNSVALGANSVASAPNTVSVGAPGSERTISNVAPGVNGTDAVDVNQLGAVAMQSNQQFNNLQEGVSRLRDDMYGGVASAMAVAGLPQPTGPGKSMVSVAGSTFHGEEGIAMGVSTITENGKWVLKGALTTNSRSDVAVVLGGGYQW